MYSFAKICLVMYSDRYFLFFPFFLFFLFLSFFLPFFFFFFFFFLNIQQNGSFFWSDGHLENLFFASSPEPRIKRPTDSKLSRKHRGGNVDQK